MKKKKKILKPYKKKIHLNDEVFSYQIHTEKWSRFSGNINLWLKIRRENAADTISFKLKVGEWISPGSDCCGSKSCSCYWQEDYQEINNPVKPSLIKELIKEFILQTQEKSYKGTGLKDNPIILHTKKLIASEENKLKFLKACKY